jgi:hypothetical protein
MHPVSNTVSSLPMLIQQTLKQIGRILLRISLVALPIIGGLALGILFVRSLESYQESSRVISQTNLLISRFESIKTRAHLIFTYDYAQSISAKIILKIADGNNFDYENSSIIPVGEEISPTSISREMDALFRLCTIPPELNVHSPCLQYKAVIILKNADLATFGWAEVSKRVHLLLDSSTNHTYFDALSTTLEVQSTVIEATGIRNIPFFDTHGNLI